LWNEEAEEIGRDEFKKIDESLRTTKGRIRIVIMLNTPPKNHWIIQFLFAPQTALMLAPFALVSDRDFSLCVLPSFVPFPERSRGLRHDPRSRAAVHPIRARAHSAPSLVMRCAYTKESHDTTDQFPANSLIGRIRKRT
jgi:hypothetical protein